MSRGLLVVDVQNDFCEGGSLGVAGGTAVAAGVTAWLAARQSDPATAYPLVVASRDAHAAPPDDNHGHFALADDPDFVTSWPVHCVDGTPGAELHPALSREHLDLVVSKGQGRQSYSAFEGVVTEVLRDPRGRYAAYAGAPLLAVLRGEGVTDLDVVGIATDHCVRASGLDALGSGVRVRVLADLVAGVAADRSAQALAELAGRGAVVAPSSAA